MTSIRRTEYYAGFREGPETNNLLKVFAGGASDWLARLPTKVLLVVLARFLQMRLAFSFPGRGKSQAKEKREIIDTKRIPGWKIGPGG